MSILESINLIIALPMVLEVDNKSRFDQSLGA